MLDPIDVQVSTGRIAHVTFRERRVGMELRLAVYIQWQGTSTEAERQECDATLCALLEGMTHTPVAVTSQRATSAYDAEQKQRKHLGIGDN